VSQPTPAIAPLSTPQTPVSPRKNSPNSPRPVTPVLVQPLTPPSFPPAATVTNQQNYVTSLPFEGSQNHVLFNKVDLIGRGAFGSVYRGLTDEGHTIAIKELQLPVIGDGVLDARTKAQVESFKKEITLMKTLHHENIVRYLGSHFDSHSIYIYVEYMAGGSVSSNLTRFGPFTEKLIKVYSRQILTGLDYLHQNLIVHRDIKGANILVDTQGKVKLADFGCSKAIQGLVSQGDLLNTMQGTPYWMAPEVMRQQGHGPPADIWSFGCTVIEMAQGSPPFAGEYSQVGAFFFDMLGNEKKPQIPTHLSASARSFIEQTLTIAPNERPKPQALQKHVWLLCTDFEPS